MGMTLGLLEMKKKIRSSHCASVETILTSIHEDASIIPGHAQWAKDLALPWAVVWVTDMAQIWCGYCCGIGAQPGNFCMPPSAALKSKKTKKQKKKSKKKKQKTNADPQAPPQTCLNRICILIKSQVIYGHIRAWKALC